MSTPQYVFDIPAFRIAYPAYSNSAVYPDGMLQMYYDDATCYISDQNSPCGRLKGTCRYKALTLMTAHLLYTAGLIAAGQTPGLVQSATIDKITISLTPPPLPDQWQWWLNSTPYGQQLLALLQVKSVGGYFVGGSLDRLAFRGAAGGFL